MSWILWIVLFSITIYSLCVFIHIVKLVISRKNDDAPIMQPSNNKKKIRTMIIMGSGGHTGEMVRLLANMDYKLFSPRLYIIANTDDMSKIKVQNMESTKDSDPDSFEIGTISRSREVGQSWITSILSSLISIFQSFKIVILNQPDLILCNGPGTCVPPCLVAFILKALWVKSTVIVFVESICRVKTLSLTGKLMAHFLADRSLVQWPELHAKYPQTVYLGRL